MKKLLLFLTLISSAALGQNDPLYKRDSVKLDTILINTYSYKANAHNKGINRNIWVVGKNISPISENEKQLLFEYLKEEIQQKLATYKPEVGVYQINQDLYFKVNNLAELRKQNFQHTEAPPTQFIEMKSNFKGDYLELSGRIGVGMIRDKISPMVEAAAGVHLWKGKKNPNWKIVKIGVQSYYTFEKNSAGNYQTNLNIFSFLSMGISNLTKNETPNNKIFNRDFSIGLGYLVQQQGGYFQGTTFKLFFRSRIKGNIGIIPELIFTRDVNMNLIYPSITIQF